MSKIDALMKTLYDKKMEKVSVIHAASTILPAGIFEDTPRTVAFVEVDKTLPLRKKLEIAFSKTNTITQSWVRNEGVEYIGPSSGCRSTSVGDMVLIGTTKYVCKMSGWETLDGEIVK
jgi:hypothetical protein